MPIEKDKVVTLHYTLIDADNDLALEKSGADAPMVYLHGAGNILAGLEQALEGKDSGDRLTVSLDPEQAYGRRDRVAAPAPVGQVPQARRQAEAR